MTDIHPQHIDAVAQAALGDMPFLPSGRLPLWAIDAARAVLNTADPAVHAAMLDALTRHGVLTKQEAPLSRDMAGWYPRWDGNHSDEGHRLVTAWEAAP